MAKYWQYWHELCFRGFAFCIFFILNNGNTCFVISSPIFSMIYLDKYWQHWHEILAKFSIFTFYQYHTNIGRQKYSFNISIWNFFNVKSIFLQCLHLIANMSNQRTIFNPYWYPIGSISDKRNAGAVFGPQFPILICF